MPMKGWQKLRYYDPHIDSEAIRFSGFDGKGGEFWVCLPLAPDGKQRRHQKAQALDVIKMAIDLGHEPGEVTIPPRNVLEQSDGRLVFDESLLGDDQAIPDMHRLEDQGIY